jgi:hypothetical protein
VTNAIENRLNRLRGSLPAEEPGARGIERVARNPDCTRLRALTIAGITPATAAVQIYGEPAREGQSPFALAIGNRFENVLMANGGAALLTRYRDNGRLTVRECKVVVVPDLAPGTTPVSMARRRAETDRLFRLKLQQSSKAPNLIVKPRIPVRLLGIDHDTEPDALVAADTDQFYRPAEIKSYPDRDGKTDAADIRGACRQAAVGVVSLRHALDRFGIRDSEQLVRSRGDLILRAPGSMRPTLREMTLRGEVASLERAIGEAPKDLDELEAMLPPGATLDDQRVLDSIPNAYRSNCREHCALAGRCKQAAIAAADPVVLGDSARELLAAAGTLSRALELLQGRGKPPRTAAEQAIADRLRESLLEYRKAVGNVP